jgi:hypothetical protein
MKKYNEEYFSVVEIGTGRKIADCGDELDALSLVAFDSKNRTIVRNKFLMSPVIDIEIPKSLPTNQIVTTTNSEFDEFFSVESNRQIELPEGQGRPIVV